jgi:hypothetical protein
VEQSKCRGFTTGLHMYEAMAFFASLFYLIFLQITPVCLLQITGNYNAKMYWGIMLIFLPFPYLISESLAGSSDDLLGIIILAIPHLLFSGIFWLLESSRLLKPRGG